jgi:rubrerythrin
MSDAETLEVGEHTGPADAMKVAMAREKTAHEFYLKCAGIVADPGVKKMFEFLAREETRHYELLEKEYNRFIAGDN